MTHLFDTNAWIRAIERPEELTAPASTIIQAAGSAPFGLSAISIYEIGQKVRKGKLACWSLKCNGLESTAPSG